MQQYTLITGLVPGYPTSELSLEIAKTLHASGADILELSASFSEPIADGPTLQLAHQNVLSSGFTKARAFALYKRIKDTTRAPLFLIEYANVIYQIGFDAYYKKAAESGINYLLVPDVPLEESAPFAESARARNISHIFMIAPTTSDTRILQIAQQAEMSESNNQAALPFSTFLYLVSVTGVTGSRKNMSDETIAFIKRVRGATDLPLIVGFGISAKEHADAVTAAGASGVVTCSAVVDMTHNLKEKPAQMQKAIGEFVTLLKHGLS